MEIKWGGSGIEKCLFEYIKRIIPEGSNVIELGAGHVSTQALSQCYDLYSVENNPDYINLYDKVNYLYCPVKDGWYDLKKEQLPKDYALVFIDGVNRLGILEHMDLFNPDTVFIIHDTYREDEIKLGFELSKRLKRPVLFFNDCDYWAVI